MTPRQTKTYWSMWNAACRAQGWHKEPAAVRDSLRYAAHRAAGVPESSKDINSTDHFDAIKAHLQMLAGNLKATVETDHPDIGSKRRLVNKIQKYQLPLLRALGCDPEHYLTPLLKQKYHLLRGLEDIDTLSAQPRFVGNEQLPSQLEQLIMDLARTIQSKRKTRAMTVHDLHARANLPCPFHCQQCVAVREARPLIANAFALDDNVPF